MKVADYINKVLEDDKENEVLYNVNRETHESSNLTDPSLNVNNVFQIYQILKVITFVKSLMINQSILRHHLPKLLSRIEVD